MKKSETIEITLKVTNTGKFEGEEVVQLYLHDQFGSVVRPIKELKGFQKVFLKKGESKELSFVLTVDDLRFYNDKLQYVYEPGEFKLFIGGSSDSVKEAGFTLTK